MSPPEQSSSRGRGRGRKARSAPKGGGRTSRPGRPWQTDGSTAPWEGEPRDGEPRDGEPPYGQLRDGELRIGASRAGTDFVKDPITGQMAERRRIQPYEARKQYICPGCNQEIRPGTRHLVVVPLGAQDLRRHWHEPCFDRASRHGFR